MLKHKKGWFFAVTIALLCGAIGVAVAVTMVKPVDILTLKITLDEDDELFEKEYSTASIEVLYPGQMNGEVLSCEIRYRGNSTYHYDKKSYKFKLTDEFDFFAEAGTGDTSDNKANDWILLANYLDKTMLRNYYAFYVASLLDGILYTTENMFIEVYYEGEYQGIYQLCEQIELDEARMDLNDKTEGDNAVLLELTQYNEKENYVGTWYGEKARMYDIHSNIYSDEQLFRVYLSIDAVNQAIIAGDQVAVEEALDMESFIDMYLLQEFTMDLDVGYRSFYLYMKEDDNKIYLGPPWDFDRSQGSTWKTTDYTRIVAAGGVDLDYDRDTYNEWFHDLMQLEWFQDMVRERWNETKDVFLVGIDEITAVEEAYGALFQDDYEYWQAGNQSQEVWMAAYEAEHAALQEWLQNRYDFLDYYFNEGVKEG